MSDSRQKAIAILPKFSAFFSLIGSGFIIYDIICSHFNIDPDWFRRKKKDEGSSGFSSKRTSMGSTSRARSSRRLAQRKTLKNSAYYRLMLAMSCSDFIVSGAWFCTTWPIPKDELSLDNPSDSVYGNIGNMQTCTAQGFIIQLGIVTPFYNALLALYYYLTIRREWKEEDFKRKVEYAGHFVSISWGVGTSIAGLAMELFNNSNVWCWISPYPSGCGDGPNKEPCVRGINSSTYRWAFYYGPLWVMIFLVASLMGLVYAYVRSLDNKMNHYTAAYTNASPARVRAGNDLASGELGGGGTGGGRRRSLMARTFSTVNTDTLNEQRRQRRNERSKAVANQGLFYAGTFALVWIFGTVVRAMQLAGAKKIPWAIVFLFAVFTPSQGFFNFLVYVRPRLIKKYEEMKKKREGQRNSKTGSSFNSDILRVSGMSGHGSSSEMTGNQHNRDGSTRSDMESSEPFQTSKEFQSSLSQEFQTPESKPVRPKRKGTPGFGKVRLATAERNQSKKKSSFPDSEYSSKVRFVSDDNKMNIIKDGKKKDANKSNRRVGIADVDMTPRDKGENGESPTVEISEPFDDAGSEATIDPDLLDDAVLGREEPTTANGGNLFDLQNATIDLATGEVRTRKGTRIVPPPS